MGGASAYLSKWRLMENLSTRWRWVMPRPFTCFQLSLGFPTITCRSDRSREYLQVDIRLRECRQIHVHILVINIFSVPEYFAITQTLQNLSHRQPVLTKGNSKIKSLIKIVHMGSFAKFGKL